MAMKARLFIMAHCRYARARAVRFIIMSAQFSRPNSAPTFIYFIKHTYYFLRYISQMHL